MTHQLAHTDCLFVGMSTLTIRRHSNLTDDMKGSKFANQLDQSLTDDTKGSKFARQLDQSLTNDMKGSKFADQLDQLDFGILNEVMGKGIFEKCNNSPDITAATANYY